MALSMAARKTESMGTKNSKHSRRDLRGVVKNAAKKIRRRNAKADVCRLLKTGEVTEMIIRWR